MADFEALGTGRAVALAVLVISVALPSAAPVAAATAPSVRSVHPTGWCGDAGVVVAPPRRGVYHGAFPGLGGSEDVVRKERIERFERLAGRRVVWVYFSNNWGRRMRFPTAAVRRIRRHGAIPFVRLMPRSGWRESHADSRWTMQRIAAGDFDPQLRAWARAARRSGGPLMAEFGAEMNGSWFPWNGKWNGGATTTAYGDRWWPDGPERYRDAHRRIVRIFRAEGARDVTWVFHADAAPEPAEWWNEMRWYYPGDDVIDWIGLSVYGATMPHERVEPAAHLLTRSYREATALSGSRPLAVVELGVTKGRGWNQAQWTRAAFRELRSGRYPRVAGVSWWHERWSNADRSVSDLRIDASPAQLAAYRAGVAHPRYGAALQLECR